MSIRERSSSPRAPVADPRPDGDRLRVVTAGRVGNMDARLGTSGFDVVAAAGTEDALIDAVSGDEPDAIVVEADLCASLERVRDLAPDAVLIVVGDHTPAGALGRVERGMSGTAMAGLLHALVAEGVGAAVVWGLVPSFRAGALHLPQRAALSLLWAKADLVRDHLANALRDPAHLATAAGTVALIVSASFVVTLIAPRTQERPDRVPLPAATAERAARDPVVAWSTTTRILTHGPLTNVVEPHDRRGQNRRESGDHVRQNHPQRHASRPPGVAYGWDHRPTKHADNGRHKGWESNSVPEDLPALGTIADPTAFARRRRLDRSVDAARAAARVRGDQDHRHEHRDPEGDPEPHLPGPTSAPLHPTRAVHLEPPFARERR